MLFYLKNVVYFICQRICLNFEDKFVEFGRTEGDILDISAREMRIGSKNITPE